MHRTPNMIHKFQCICVPLNWHASHFSFLSHLSLPKFSETEFGQKSLGLIIPLQSCKLRARKKYVITVALVEKVKKNTCKEENGVLTSHPFQMEFGSTLFPKSLQKKTNNQTENTGPMFHKNWKPFPHFWGLS